MNMTRALMTAMLGLVFSLAGLARAEPAVPPNAPFDPPGYLAELDHWRAAVEQLPAHPEQAGALRRELPPAWSIRLEGHEIKASTEWLRARLAAIENDPAAAAEQSRGLKAHLETLRQEAAALAEEAGIPSRNARETLSGILARREFRAVREPTWLTRLRQRIVETVIHLLEKVFEVRRVPQRITGVVAWVLAIGLALVFLVWLARHFLRLPVAQGLELPTPGPLERGWREWGREAREAAGRGRFRDAVRLAYWSGVYRLEEAGLWQVERARTPREYVRLLPSSHPGRGPLASLTSRFERVWYGSDTASADDFHFAVTQLEKLGCPFPSTPAIGNS